MVFKALAALAAVSSINLFSVTSGNPLPLQARDLLTPLSATATADQMKWSPALDYDTDSCYNVAAINAKRVTLVFRVIYGNRCSKGMGVP
jgi:hypothetical protein